MPSIRIKFNKIKTQDINRLFIGPDLIDVYFTFNTISSLYIENINIE
jgi:hypothetical protein